jgi:hypothetical protein
VTLILTLAGWLGALLLLLTYGLASAGRLDISSAPYQALNLAGALGLALNAVAHLAWPAAVLNTLWVAIGLSTLTRLAADRRSRQRPAALEDAATEAPSPTDCPSPGRRRHARVGNRSARRTASTRSSMRARLRRSRPATRAPGDRRRLRLPKGARSTR